MAFRPFLFIYFSIKEKPQLNQGMENKNRFPPLLYFLSCSVYLAVFQFPAEGSEPLSRLETFRVGTMSPAWWLVGGHPGEADPRQPSPACWLVARVEHHWSGEGGGGPSVAPTNGCFPAGSLSPPTSQPVCAWFHCTGSPPLQDPHHHHQEQERTRLRAPCSHSPPLHIHLPFPTALWASGSSVRSKGKSYKAA